MPDNNRTLHSDGSYISELAIRALERPIPSDLVVDLEEYERWRNTARQEENLKLMADFLARNPQLQEQLAFLFDYVPSKWLLSQEIPAVVNRRKIHGIDASFDPSGNPYVWARDKRLQGLCLSGGGIRSATFSLGVLQGLAKLEMLHRFDYLSSVSGGGYIHQWLAGWINREEGKTGTDECRTKPADLNKASARAGLGRVQCRLQPLPAGEQLPFQPEPIRWLRRYSNYLTPRKGLLSADTWVAIAIWLRNTFLNQLILISGLFFLVLLPNLLSPALRAIPGWAAGAGTIVLFALAAIAMWIALGVEFNRVRYLDKHDGSPATQKSRRFGGERTVQRLIVLPLLVASVSFLVAIDNGFQGLSLPLTVFISLTVMICGITFAGGAIRSYKANHGMIKSLDTKVTPTTAGASGCEPKAAPNFKEFFSTSWHRATPNLKIFFSAILASAVIDAGLAAAAAVPMIFAIVCLLGIPHFALGDLSQWCHLHVWFGSAAVNPQQWRLQLTVGPPLFLCVPFFSLILAAGLVGRNYPDWLREWLARVRAWSMLFALGWLVCVGITLLGPSLLEWFRTTEYKKLAGSIKWSAVAAWVVTTAGSVMAGKSKKATGSPQDSAPALNLLAKTGPYVFILGLLLILSGFANSAFQWAECDGKLATALLLLLPLAIFLLFGWRVDVNEFSMNPFYRNRLTRCYLGSTNLHRDPNPLTGFDDRDTRGMQISRLKPNSSAPGSSDQTTGYSGPLPIINTTVNLSFGEDLAWQERKAASFAFSPIYSGYTVGWTAGKAGDDLSFNGFVPTAQYFDPDGGINISTAVAISGAAASPNWGYHTNPATAFLMTLFNVRLGWWIFNPRRSKLAGCLANVPTTRADTPAVKLEWPSPRFAPKELFKELLGRTNDTSDFVYLSDGGHFDNMGLYELVRRRCYRIVICDAEQDEKYVFEGIGMAIRKCRIDFGVEITLDPFSNLRPDLITGDCKAHFAIGKIRYPETPSGKKNEGIILYLKSSLTGSAKWLRKPPDEFTPLDAEPLDILNYKLQHNSFPHDTTANQWFTESQFESYRRLGEHVVDEIERCDQWAEFR